MAFETAMRVGKSLKHKTMASAAAEEIRNRIVNGDYPPGYQLRQDALANELGMSRIPVREALVQLESEDLVEILPHRGAVVVELSVEEIDEVFNMRLLLEPYVFARSAPHLTASDFRVLTSIQKRFAESIDNLDKGRWNELNTEFHLQLYRHARSPRVMTIVQNLLVECDRHTRIQLSQIDSERKRAVREHGEILKLCKKAKYEEGTQLLREHIIHIRVVLLELLESNREKPKAAADGG